MTKQQAADRRYFKRFKKGDRPSASENNKHSDALEDLTRTHRQTEKHFSKIRLIQTDQVVGSFWMNPSQQQKDRQLSFRYWDKNTETFQPGDRPQVANLCDPFELIYDSGEYLLAFYSEQGTKYYPINPRTVRHAITCRDQSNYYPPRAINPDTYPIRWVKLVYTEIAGRRGHALTYLNADNTGASEDDHVHNIIDPDLEPAYIPEGTLIECYNVTRQWFTMYTGESDDSSVSGSDSSLSSSSDSSQSSSSHSSSSDSSVSHSSSRSSASSASSASSLSSSFSSSSQSISESSESSSSVSVSDSSSSDSSQSASSQSASSISRSESSISVSESSGYDCITVVSGETPPRLEIGPPCEIVWCTRQICFPKGLGVVIHPEVCA